MSTTTVSSREFNQDVGRAKKAAEAGPVVITDRGRPSHVLLSIADYRKLTEPTATLAETLAESEPTDFDFEAPRSEFRGKPVDLA